ncbi:MAG: transporter [Candidatus Omnitrophota bacterium]|nr:transporter [Candidatus Omnitrophota bacterium]
MKIRFILILLLLIIVPECSIYAADKSEIWDPITPGPFTTFTAPVVEKNKFVLQPLYFFNIGRGAFDGEGGYNSLPGKDYKYHQVIQLYTQYGLADRTEINCQPSWDMHNIRQGGNSAEAAGFGDFLMNARYCGIDESAWCPRVTGLFQVKLPTGKYQNADPDKLGGDIIGTGSTDYTYGLSFTKGAYPIRTLFHLDLLLTNAPSPVRIDGVKTGFSDTYIVNGAFEWIFYKKMNLMGELLWQTQGDKKLDGNWTADTSKSSLILSMGIGYSEKDWQMLVGYQRTLLGENVDANDTIAGTVIINF